VTINGSNDDPTIGGAATGAVTEDGTTTISGDLTKADVDTNDTHTWEVSNNGQGEYGTFSVDGSGRWTYVLDNDNTLVQALAEDQQVSDIITVTVSDGKGGSATQQVTVTINGSNDDPTIGGAATGAVTEDGTTTISGNLTKADVDTNDTHTWEVSNDGQGQYGTFSVDSTGRWTYVLDNDNTLVQALAEDQQVSDIITVTVSDGKGGSATQQVTVTINGSNDDPTIGGAATGAVTEDGTTTISGDLTKADVDTNDT
ncbi:VCBS domain-containing protein, partial [Acidovorax cavernicola]